VGLGVCSVPLFGQLGVRDVEARLGGMVEGEDDVGGEAGLVGGDRVAEADKRGARLTLDGHGELVELVLEMRRREPLVARAALAARSSTPRWPS
jgi:hypothetical protein